MAKTYPFDKFSDRYEDWFEKNSEAYNAELAAIRQLMPQKDFYGLEVGVGSGKFAAPLGIKLGIEPSEIMAAKAEKLGIRVLTGVAESLPFKGAEFDLLLMVTTICFVDDILKSFKEAIRVLKDNGALIVGFVDKDSDLGREYLKHKSSNVFYKEATFFSTSEVKDYLFKAGFVKMSLKQTLIAGKSKQIIEDGSGKGAFVVIKAYKSEK